MSRGYVYILTNPSMPGLVKIGKTTRDPEDRAHEVSGATGVPTPFDVYGSFYSMDCDYLEGWAHERLADSRVSLNREFFKISAQDAYTAIAPLHLEQTTEAFEEFLPGHRLINEYVAIDEADVSQVAHRADVDPAEVASAFYLMEAEEIRPALARWRDVIQRRRAEREERAIAKQQGSPELRVVDSNAGDVL